MTLIRAVLFDLDGVIRLFDPEETAQLEDRFDLGRGAIEPIAFEPTLLEQVVTGRITRADWLERIGEVLQSREAVEAWGSIPTRLNQAVLELADDVRSHGLRTAILTNGTDTVTAEIAAMGIGHRFDAIFNSAEIGWAKPDVHIYRHALDTLGLAPDEVFFTDDSAEKLGGARALGMQTHLFTGAGALRAALQSAGVLG